MVGVITIVLGTMFAKEECSQKTNMQLNPMCHDFSPLRLMLLFQEAPINDQSCIHFEYRYCCGLFIVSIHQFKCIVLNEWKTKKKKNWLDSVAFFHFHGLNLFYLHFKYFIAHILDTTIVGDSFSFFLLVVMLLTITTTKHEWMNECWTISDCIVVWFCVLNSAMEFKRFHFSIR